MDSKKKDIDAGKDIESLLLEQAERDHDPELDFDRFMVGVVESQEKADKKLVTEDSPIRKFNRRYRETAANRIRFK